MKISGNTHMKQRENRPFYFAICVWLATVAVAPLAWFEMKRLVPFWGPDLQPEPADGDLKLLPIVYLVTILCSFLILGLFYFGARLLARTKMPMILAKAILSCFVIGLIWLAFYLIDADMDGWSLLLMFRCFYVVAIIFIWIFPLRNRLPGIAKANVVSESATS